MKKIMATLYPLMMTGIALAALFLWWRGGMWAQGELPTHGMIHAILGSALALLFYGIARILRR